MRPAVLVVEDDTSFAETIAGGLREQSMQVHLAETEAAAQRLVTGKTVDVILPDLGLPSRDGIEMLDVLTSCTCCLRDPAQGGEEAAMEDRGSLRDLSVLPRTGRHGNP